MDRLSPDTLAAALIQQHGAEALAVAMATVLEVSTRSTAAAVAKYAREPVGRKVRPAATISTTVANYYYMNLNDLMARGHRRSPKHATEARHMAWALMRHRLRMSLTQIGHEFDRDHTTILAGLRKFIPSQADWAELNRQLDAMDVPCLSGTRLDTGAEAAE